MGYLQDKACKLGAKTEYRSIYGYQKYRVKVLDANTGDTLGEIKEEVTPGVPGQADITVYYEKNRWRDQGKLRFYQSPEALIIACGGKIDTSRIAPPAPEPEAIEPEAKPVIKRKPKPAVKVSTARRKKTVKKTDRQKSLNKSVRIATAKKTTPGARKRKVKSAI